MALDSLVFDYIGKILLININVKSKHAQCLWKITITFNIVQSNYEAKYMTVKEENNKINTKEA